jgi:thioredoxin 1
LLYLKYKQGEKNMPTVKVTSANFETEVIKSNKPVIIDFYADWCGPCKILGPTMEQIADERSDLKVVKINVDEEGELAQQFNVMSIPTIVVMKEGKVTNGSMGVQSKDRVLKLLEK